MGYESKLYIVDKANLMMMENKKYADVIAIYNMSKFDGFRGIFEKETDCYIYADDGNTKIVEDCYGEALKEDTIENVIKYLEEQKKEDGYYRRIDPLLSLLKGFNLSDWQDLVVLHYGY